MTCDMRYGCEECTCPEIRMLRKEIRRLRADLDLAVKHIYYLVDDLEEKKCQ